MNFDALAEFLHWLLKVVLDGIVLTVALGAMLSPLFTLPWEQPRQPRQPARTKSKATFVEGPDGILRRENLTDL